MSIDKCMTFVRLLLYNCLLAGNIILMRGNTEFDLLSHKVKRAEEKETLKYNGVVQEKSNKNCQFVCDEDKSILCQHSETTNMQNQNDNIDLIFVCFVYQIWVTFFVYNFSLLK